MQVVRLTTLDQLAPLATDWDRLAREVPFRGWAWASNWWRHYGHDQDVTRRDLGLYVLCVRNPAGAVVGIAPWYVDRSPTQGRVLRFLGTGEVCSDYLSVLCAAGLEDRVADALACWLADLQHNPAKRSANGNPDRWDLLELTGVDAEDIMVARLAEKLEARGSAVHRRRGPNCWRLELPRRWDDYLAVLSKNHRKQIRRIERDLLGTGRAMLHSVERLADLDGAQRILIDLHQRRRLSLGTPGRFASGRFCAFHEAAMPQLLRSGQLHLAWIELDGRPVAAEYQLTGDGVVYAYQAGVEPDALKQSPGRLVHATTIRRAIEQGYRAFDFLRGDEPYKANWRAAPRESLEIRVAAARPSARLRQRMWLAKSSLKQWVKGVVGSDSR